MKTRKKMLAVLLSVSVVLAFMPSMAFASVVESTDDLAIARVQNPETTIASATDLYYDNISQAINSATDGATVTISKSTIASGISINKDITFAIASGKKLKLEGSNSIGSKTKIVNEGTIEVEGSLDMSTLATNTDLAGSGNIKLTTATSKLLMPSWFDKTVNAGIFGTIAEGATLTIKGDGTYTYKGGVWSKSVASWNNNEYPSIGEALDAAKGAAASSTSQTITILQNTSDAISIGSDSASMTYTINGGSKELSGNISVASGKLVLNGGIYSGTITKGTNGKISVVSGSFSADAYTAIKDYIASGSYVVDAKANPVVIKVAEKTLDNATVTGVAKTYLKAATAIKPAVTVYDGSTKLTAGTDYTVEYGANNAVGTGSVIIKGKGSYAGSKDKVVTFEIIATARNMSNATIATIPSQKYSTTVGISGAKPPVTVTWKATAYSTPVTLVEGVDYTVTYSNNKAIGTASVTVKGIGAYSGYAYGSFEITGNLDLGLTVISSIPDQKYTGAEVKPSLIVKYGSTYLYEGTDYTAVYSSNKYVGTATVKITGKGKYTGTNSATFKIKYDLAGATVTPSATTLKWNGSAQAPTVTVKYGTTGLTAGTDYVLSSTAYNKNCGTYTVTVNAVSTSSKAMGSTSFTYTIDGTDQSITGVSSTYKKTTYTESFKLKPDAVDATGFTYTSADPDVATVSSDGTVTIKSIGTTTITISTVGNTKYNPAVKKVNLIVNPRVGYLKSVTSPSKGKLTFKYYKRPGGISGVQVRYSRYSDFRTYGTKTIVTTNSKDYSVTGTKSYTGFKSGRVLYVKTRNYKELDDGTRLYGAWSTAKKVVVK